ncbi:metal-sulfur cluster assembly factor [bacterium]|nr:metal-sulfur cluster assembly factor [bacterium]
MSGILWEALRKVEDPELPVSVVDLGIVRSAEMVDKVAHVTACPTSPLCPLLGELGRRMKESLLEIKGVERVKLTWEPTPPWTPDRITPLGRKRLKGMGLDPDR